MQSQSLYALFYGLISAPILLKSSGTDALFESSTKLRTFEEVQSSINTLWPSQDKTSEMPELYL